MSAQPLDNSHLRSSSWKSSLPSSTVLAHYSQSMEPVCCLPVRWGDSKETGSFSKKLRQMERGGESLGLVGMSLRRWRGWVWQRILLCLCWLFDLDQRRSEWLSWETGGVTNAILCNSVKETKVQQNNHPRRSTILSQNASILDRRKITQTVVARRWKRQLPLF